MQANTTVSMNNAAIEVYKRQVQMSWAQKSAANTPLATPLWIPQGLWLLGLAWMRCV